MNELLKEKREETDKRETEKMMTAIHRNYQWARMERQLETLEKGTKKRETVENFSNKIISKLERNSKLIIAIIIFLVVALGIFVKISDENDHKRVKKECEEQGLTVVEKYTKEADKYYVCGGAR